MVLKLGGGKQQRSYLRYSAVGIELALSVVGGMLGGWWLDDKFHTKPWLTLLGLLLGVVAGFKSLIEAANRISKEIKSDDENE